MHPGAMRLVWSQLTAKQQLARDIIRKLLWGGKKWTSSRADIFALTWSRKKFLVPRIMYSSRSLYFCGFPKLLRWVGVLNLVPKRMAVHFLYRKVNDKKSKVLVLMWLHVLDTSHLWKQRPSICCHQIIDIKNNQPSFWGQDWVPQTTAKV